MYCDDVSEFMITAWIVALIVVVFAVFIAFLASSDNKMGLEKKASEAERFNELNRTERQAVAKWLDLQDEVDDNYFLSVPEIVSTGDYFRHRVPWPILLSIGYLIFSIVCFCKYLYAKESQYFICDLPMKSDEGQLVFISTLFCFPIYLISFFCLLWWKHGEADRIVAAERAKEEARLRAEEEEKQRQEDAERIARETPEERQLRLEAEERRLSEYSEAEAEAMRAAISHRFDDHAKESYIACMQRYAELGWQTKLDEACAQVTHCENVLRSRGDEVKRAQNQLRQAKLEYQQLSEQKPDPVNRKQLMEDFEAISNMRGVTNIFCRKTDTTKPCIYIDVTVCYPDQDGEIYDLGDYRISIQYDATGRNYFKCINRRLPVRLNYHGSVPGYLNHDKTFCFGSRSDRINGYVVKGKIREAVILMIDALHSFNGGDENSAARRIPQAFKSIGKVQVNTD